MNKALETNRKQVAEKLSSQSSLYDHMPLEDAKFDRDFISRLNTRIASSFTEQISKGRRPPKSLEEAIKSRGELNPHAEIEMFGRWLLIDGHPGLKKSPGKQPNKRNVLKCVGTGVFEHRMREAAAAFEFRKSGRKRKQNEITKNDLSKRWELLFGQKAAASDFDARIRTLKRILPKYLEHLESSGITLAGKKVRSSPQIRAVMEAITPIQHSEGPAQSTGVPETPIPASLAPFSFDLNYSSEEHRNTYRAPSVAGAKETQLHYTTSELESAQPSRIVLKPELSFDFKTRALIDRIVILFQTNNRTNLHTIKKKIKESTGAAIYARDLTDKYKEKDWEKTLPEIDRADLRGYFFAALLQDPTPKFVEHVLQTLRSEFEVSEDIIIHLVEVAVDFYPDPAASQSERTTQREQLVGLLQRHHWVEHRKFLTESENSLRYTDARQIYGSLKNTRYLFADQRKGNRNKSDNELKEPKVRERIKANSKGSGLFLNSTLYKGRRNSGFQVNIQHKVADERNRAKNTLVDLPEQRRRARMELTIVGSEVLEAVGLLTIDNLSKISFRKIVAPFLGLYLGTTKDNQSDLDAAKMQLQTRGVYGLELRERLNEIEVREKARGSKRKFPRKYGKEGSTLEKWSEMNKVTGKSLDRLSERWREFSWR